MLIWFHLTLLILLKSDYSNLKMAQWFLDPLNSNGPDYEKKKKEF